MKTDVERGGQDKPVPSPVLLREEGLLLLKHWIREMIATHLFMYTAGHWCKHEDHELDHFSYRFNAICQLLSKDDCESVIKQARDEVEKEHADDFFYRAMKEGRKLLLDDDGHALPPEQQTAETGDPSRLDEKASDEHMPSDREVES